MIVYVVLSRLKYSLSLYIVYSNIYLCSVTHLYENKNILNSVLFLNFTEKQTKKVINILAVNNIERLTLMFSFLFGVSVPSMLEKIIYIKSHIILLQSKNIKCIRIITKLRLYSLIIVLCKK